MLQNYKNSVPDYNGLSDGSFSPQDEKKSCQVCLNLKIKEKISCLII